MKASQILKEVAKEKGIESAELVLSQALELIEALGPRLATEAEESTAKIVGQGMSMIVPVLKPTLVGLIDLNKDGKIG